MDREPMPRWLLGLTLAGAAAVLIPFGAWVVLGLWLAVLAGRVQRPILRMCRGRRGLAATLTILLLLGLMVPVAMLVASVALDAIALVRELMASEQGISVLEQLAEGNGAGATTRESLTSTEGITSLLMNQGGRAWVLFKQVAGAAVHGVIGVLILVTGMYGVLVEGPAWYGWFERHAPIPPASLRRISGAFIETGRGLAIGIVGAGLIQSLIATIAYVVIGVPQALALGLLTLLFSVVPAVGTAVVWAPVAAGLYVTGREGAAIALVIIGVAVIGTVDNLARPYLARKGHLALPTYVVLLSMFGGIELIGAWGLVIGPLVVRLAKEAILLRSESRGVAPTVVDPTDPTVADPVADPAAADLATSDGP